MTTTADDVWQLLAELITAQKETERRQQETERLIQELTTAQKETNRQTQETDRKIREVNKQIGDLGKVGTFCGKYGGSCL